MRNNNVVLDNVALEESKNNGGNDAWSCGNFGNHYVDWYSKVMRLKLLSECVLYDMYGDLYEPKHRNRIEYNRLGGRFYYVEEVIRCHFTMSLGWFSKDVGFRLGFSP